MLGSPRKNFTSLLYPNFTEELGQLSLNSQVGLGMAVGPSLPPDFSGPGRSPGRGPEATHTLLAIGWLKTLFSVEQGVDPDKNSLEQGHLIPNITLQSPHLGSFIATNLLGSFSPPLA